MFELLVVGLAAWRISRMLVTEQGPWNIFRRLREATGIKYYSHSNDIVEGLDNPLACMYCTSVWLVIGFYFAPLWITTIFAAAAIPALIEEVKELWE